MEHFKAISFFIVFWTVWCGMLIGELFYFNIHAPQEVELAFAMVWLLIGSIPFYVLAVFLHIDLRELDNSGMP